MSDERAELPHLGFKRFAPSTRLSNLIECYWFINTTSEVTPIHPKEYLHPEGGFGIILNYADALEFDGTPQQSPCVLDGTNTQSRELGFSGSLDAIGIRFKAAGGHLLLPVPLNELKNGVAPLSELPLRKYNQLYARLAKSQSYSNKIETIENWLYNNLQARTTISEVVARSLHLIRLGRGQAAIESVAAKLACSQRTVERQFVQQVGMTPKEFSRNLRIKAARSYIKSADHSFSEVAQKLGFHDQAHFIHQFRAVTGITPGEYLRKSSAARTAPASPDMNTV